MKGERPMSSTPRRMPWIFLTLAGLVPTLLGAQEITREQGYDRRGNDYTSFHARSLSACVETCRDDGRCRAYSYDTREGTCYLKERVNSAQRKEEMVTGYKREDGGDRESGLTEERGYDRRGNDYTSFRARGLSDCLGACRKDRRCRAYTYDTRNDACYLKDRANSAQRNDEMVTGYKREDGGDYDDDDDFDLTEERGYDRRGNDYTSFRARGLSDCMAACRRDGRCRAYTYDTRNDACYLKDRVNSSQRDNDMVTGYKREGD
jgi:hypothetical protein